MKKLLLSTIALIGGFSMSAQLNNMDFEDWTNNINSGYDSLHFWTTSNDLGNQLAAGLVPNSVFEETTTSSSGNSSVRMETINCFACALAGGPPEVPGSILQSESYTQRPESVTFDYQFNQVNGDMGAGLVLLTNSVSGDTIAATIFTFENTVNTWTNMTVPLSYFSQDNPDSIQVIFSSSADLLFSTIITTPPAQVGTELWVDGLGLIMPTPGVASPVGLIEATDVADNGNGLDLQVEYFQAQDETTINEYRVMAVKEANAGTFDLTAAQAATEYYAVPPLGTPISGTFTAASNDVDGDPIQDGQPYRIFVMSEADGTNATTDNLSPMSNSVTLNAQPADTAINVLSADISNVGDGSDLDVQFEPAGNENTISEYRIMVVKASNAGSFNLAAAEAVASANYVTHTPDGNIYQSTMGAGANDADGDAITENVPYRVFVLSMADGTNASLNALSNPSNEVELSNPASTEDISKEAWSIYPNPVEAELSLNLNGQAKVTIMDMIGKVVYEKDVNNTTVIATDSFEKGAYLIQVELNGQTKTKKFIKK